MFGLDRTNNNKGFSLLEMLVVIAISAVLVAFASLSLAVINNSKVNDAASRMTSMIRSARTQSIAKGTDAGRLTLSVEDGKLYGQIGDGAKELISSSMIDVYITNYTTAAPNTTVYSLNNMTTPASGTYTIEFEPSGVVASQSTSMPASIIFARNDRHWKIVLYHETGKSEAFSF